MAFPLDRNSLTLLLERKFKVVWRLETDEWLFFSFCLSFVKDNAFCLTLAEWTRRQQNHFVPQRATLTASKHYDVSIVNENSRIFKWCSSNNNTTTFLLRAFKREVNKSLNRGKIIWHLFYYSPSGLQNHCYLQLLNSLATLAPPVK